MVDPYKDIPSLDIEIGEVEEVRRKPSWLMLVMSVIFILVTALTYLLLIPITPPEYMSDAAKSGYIKGRLISPIVLPFLILGFLQIFKVCRTGSARVKILFWVSLFFMIGAFGQLLGA